MNKESIQKEIDYEINVKNNLWTAFMITIGATITQMFNFNNLLKFIPVIIGIIASYILINGYFKKEDLILTLIKKLEQYKEEK